MSKFIPRFCTLEHLQLLSFFFSFFCWLSLHPLLISGISYLSRSQEEEALRLLENKGGLFDSPCSSASVAGTPSVRMADTLFSVRMKIKLSEWRSGLLRCGPDFHGSLKSTNETTFFQMRPALVLKGLTSRQLTQIKLVMFLIPFLYPFSKVSAIAPIIYDL